MQTDFDFERTHTRRTDPATSHYAAAIASIRAGSHKARILEALELAHGPLAFEQIAQRTGLTESQVWKRLSDLKADGLIEDSGDRHTNQSGAPSIQWRVKG